MQTVTQSETYQNEIGGLDQRISTAESKLTPEAMETTIENSEALSEVRQTADKVNWIVESGTSSSNMTLTDDALSVISEGITLTADKINLVADDINLTGNTSVNTIVSNATDELETQIQQNTDNITIIASETNKATPYISDTPPEAPIEEGKLWIDTGVEPDVWRFWRGADVPTDREYKEIVSSDTNSPACITIDNAMGQLQTVALEIGCIAQQAGSGDPSPSNVRPISGRDSVEARACGASLFDFYSLIPETATLNGITADKLPDGRIHVHGTNTNDGFTNVVHVNIPTEQRPTFPAGTYSVGSNFNVGTNLGNKMGSFYAAEQMTASYFFIAVGANATVDFYAMPMLVFGNVAPTVYEPYRPMGGGTAMLSEPLYGLQGAEDTVEVSVDGDVLVTHRTGYIASYNGESLPGRWISSHDTYSENAIPTTGAQVVYEMTAPETEVATAIQPVAPDAGMVNIWTDGNTLEASVQGSGWEVINNTDDIREDVADVQGDIRGMLGNINTIENNLAATASQILTPDQIISTVIESTDFQTVSTQVTQTGEGLAIVQTTVDDLGERIGVVEGVVVIQGANIDIGRTDSDTKLHLDNDGWDILEGGYATISARENKVVSPRYQVTDALIIGSLALRPSGGHLRLLKYGA